MYCVEKELFFINHLRLVLLPDGQEVGQFDVFRCPAKNWPGSTGIWTWPKKCWCPFSSCSSMLTAFANCATGAQHLNFHRENSFLIPTSPSVISLRVYVINPFLFFSYILKWIYLGGTKFRQGHPWDALPGHLLLPKCKASHPLPGFSGTLSIQRIGIYTFSNTHSLMCK